MAKYKIESTYFEFPLIIETYSNDEAFEMFVAYQMSDELNDDGEEESIAKFTFTRI